MTYQSIIVSDLHLGTKDSKCEEFLEFLDTHKTHQLILNGDIIDGWAINRGGKWRKEHTKVLGKLLRLSNDIQIIWIRGNHDDFLTEFIGNAFGGIEFREDWGQPLHEMIRSDFETDLTTTEKLSRNCLSLPIWIGLTEEEIVGICQILS